ncbi:hypothetical protein [Nonomuraea sp. NPDC049141]|uniref:hypothetical protein n=1 Tax=Nonomuraea sp. NPDC049141 TaxID=3155500 RepID=UPI0033E5ABC0
MEDDEPPGAQPEPAEPVESVEVDQVPASAATPPPLPLPEVPDAQAVEQADAYPAAVDQPPAAAAPSRSPRSCEPAPPVPDGVPWTTEVDPVKRRRWFTDEEIEAHQVVKTDRGAYWVIVAGHLLGTVQLHHTATGGRSGWEARHRGGSLAWHLGTGAGGGKRPATRDKAVIDLISDVHHAWRNHRERAKRDATLARLEARDPS